MQFTKEQAIAFAKGGEWKNWDARTLAWFQLNQDKLCCDFSAFHKAMEESLGRSVWTHEFADRQRLIDEFTGKCAPPSMQDIIEMIPPDKLIVVKA